MIHADSSAFVGYDTAIFPLKSVIPISQKLTFEATCDFISIEQPPDKLSQVVLEVPVCSCRMPLSDIKSVVTHKAWSEITHHGAV